MNTDLGNIKVEEDRESLDEHCSETFSFQIKTEELIDSNSYCTKDVKTESNESEFPRCDINNQGETYTFDVVPKDENYQSNEPLELKEEVFNHLNILNGEYTFNIIGNDDVKVQQTYQQISDNLAEPDEPINNDIMNIDRQQISPPANRELRADPNTSRISTESNSNEIPQSTIADNNHKKILNHFPTNQTQSQSTLPSNNDQEGDSTRQPLDPYSTNISTSNVIHPRPNIPVSQKQMEEAIRFDRNVGYSDLKFGSLHCHVCKAVFKSIYAFYSHHFVEHRNPEPLFQCDLCQKMFMRRRYMEKHRDLHKGLKPFKCEVCGKAFASMTGVRSHMVSHQNERPHGCHLCDLKFKTQSALVKHVKTHSGLKPFKCEVCEKFFTTASVLKSHAQSHKGKTFKCEECGKLFTRRKTLLNHQRIHTGKNLYNCTQCNKAFTSAGLLKTHLLTHSDARPVECQECGSKFKTKAHLAKHMSNVHSDKRDFPCDKCEAKFKQKQALDRHMLIHTGAKPYKCDICGKAFNQQCSVKRHKFQVHNKKPNKKKYESESEASESEASESEISESESDCNGDVVDFISDDNE